MAKHKQKKSATKHKKVAYKKGNVLTVSYSDKNGVFSFGVVAQNSGKRIGEYQIKGTTIMGIMGMPLVISQS